MTGHNPTGHDQLNLIIIITFYYILRKYVKNKFQSENIILDIFDSILSKKLILKQVKKLYTTSGREWIKCVLIVKNFELIKIFVRK